MQTSMETPNITVCTILTSLKVDICLNTFIPQHSAVHPPLRPDGSAEGTDASSCVAAFPDYCPVS